MGALWGLAADATSRGRAPVSAPHGGGLYGPGHRPPRELNRQVRNHLAHSRTTSLTCKALRSCPGAIVPEPTPRSNALSLHKSIAIASDSATDLHTPARLQPR